MVRLRISPLVVGCFRGFAGVNVTSAAVGIEDKEFFVIKSQISLKAGELTLPLRKRYQSPSLLQISTIPLLAFDRKSI